MGGTEVKLYELLEVVPGLTAVIGSGGKTSLLYHLAGELAEEGHTVLLATTTHMFKPDQIPFAADAGGIRDIFVRRRIACTGAEEKETGKIVRPAFDGWQTMADYVLVEADGSKSLPLKAHAEYEPVIPPEANQVIGVLGLAGLGRAIREAAHRPSRYAQLARASEEDLVTPEMAARVIAAENLCTRVFLNQTDVLDSTHCRAWLKRFSGEAGCPVVSGSLRTGRWKRII